jgi:hypothetical protein
MATATLRKKATSLTALSSKGEKSPPEQNFEREKILVDIPQSDKAFFRLFADKMGWTIESQEDLLDRYIATRPKNVPLTEEDIMEAVREARYGEVADSH